MNISRICKIIYIGWVGDYSLIPSQEDDSFYLWGWGSVLGKEILERTSKYTIEVWRPEKRVKEISSRRVQGINTRLFPYKKMITPDIPADLIKHLIGESKMQRTIIHNDTVYGIRTYGLAFLLPNSLLVAQAHGDVRPDLAFKINPSIKTLIKLVIAPISLRRLKYIWVLRRDDYNWITRFTHPDKVGFLTEGVDEHLFCPHDKVDCRTQIGLSLSEKVICYVGQATYEKGVDYVIRSYWALKAEGLKVQLLLVGLRENEPVYKMAKESGAVVVGRVPQEQLPVYLSASDAYALATFPHRHQRGIDGSALQGLACNIPLVSPNLAHFPLSDVSGIGLIPKDPDDLTNCLRQVLLSPETYSRVRELTLPYITWDAIVSKAIHVYDGLVEKMGNK